MSLYKLSRRGLKTVKNDQMLFEFSKIVERKLLFVHLTANQLVHFIFKYLLI